MNLLDLFRPKTAEPTPKKRPRRRKFSATKVSPTLADWLTRDMSADAEILENYERLRARSRSIMHDNPYGVSFKRLLADNVIGARPVKLENCATVQNGDPDTRRNQMVVEAWEEWHEAENCTVTLDQHYYGVERTCLGAVATDGFVIVRLVSGFDNGWNFALQVLESDHLDHKMMGRAANGNVIQGGVEMNSWGRAVAYYLHTDHPNQITTATRYGPRQRISADDVIFLFVRDRPQQTLGSPWAASALVNLRHMGAYQEAAVVEARAGAAKMGIYQRRAGDEFSSADIEEGDDDEDFAWEGKTEELEPGSIITAPDGYEFTGFDPKNPNGEISLFTKTILRGVAAGLGCSYNNLASDFESVNFSSAKMGNSKEQDFWRALQFWWIKHFERRVFMAWYPMAILSGKLDIPPRFASSVCKPTWRGRGWQSPDPDKESRAHERNIKMGLDSRTRITAANGLDYDKVVTDLAAEEGAAEDNGVSVTTDKATATVTEAPVTEEEEETEETEAGM